jgi:hypothetical protein
MTEQEIKNASSKDLRYRLIILETRLQTLKSWNVGVPGVSQEIVSFIILGARAQMFKSWNVGVPEINQEIECIKSELKERDVDTKENE